MLVSAWLIGTGAMLSPWQAFAEPEENAPLYCTLMASMPRGAFVLTPPGGLPDLELRATRSRFVQLRQMPGSLRLLSAWSRQLADLAAAASLSASHRETLASRYDVSAVLTRDGQQGPPRWHRTLMGSRWRLLLLASAQ
jgi:hypothetical protein